MAATAVAFSMFQLFTFSSKYLCVYALTDVFLYCLEGIIARECFVYGAWAGVNLAVSNFQSDMIQWVLHMNAHRSLPQKSDHSFIETGKFISLKWASSIPQNR